MPEDLVVPEGTNVVLDENPPQHLAESFQRVHLRTLGDLVDNEVISSDDSLNSLLEAAKNATRSALESRSTYVPAVRVPGTLRPDLRRYGSYSAATGSIHPGERDTFWRVAREIEPAALANVTRDTPLAGVLTSAQAAKLSTIFKYLFQDVTVQSNGTLTITAAVQHFTCGNLLIERYGRILVQGSGVKISAFSIQGIQ